MKNKSYLLRSVVAAAALYMFVYLAIWLAGMVDYSFVAADQPPIFARFVVASEDGGSTAYHGFGYSIATHRKMFLSKNGQIPLQDFGAEIVFRWQIVFPSVGRVREKLDFHVRRVMPELAK